jgi:hypothetical protein
MNDVVDYERDFRRVKQGETLIYTTLHGLKPDLSMPSDVPMVLDEKAKIEIEVNDAEIEKNEQESGSSTESSSDEDESNEDESEEDDENEELEDGSVRKKTINIEIHNRPRDESPNSKRVITFLYCSCSFIY